MLLNLRLFSVNLFLLYASVTDCSSASPGKLRFKVTEGSGAQKTIAIISQKLGLGSTQYNSPEGSVSGYSFRLFSHKRAMSDLFQIDETTSQLQTRVDLDRDTLCQRYQLCCEPESSRTTDPCHLGFKVVYIPSKSSANTGRQMGFCYVDIQVEDVNDCKPKFQVTHNTIDISESAKVGDQFPLPKAIDADGGLNAIQSYRIDGGNGRFHSRNERVGEGELIPSLELNEALDRERKSKYHVKLIAMDGGSPPKSGTVQLTIQVIDENDNSPVVEPSLLVNVKEDTPVSSIIGRVKASDLDAGNNAKLTYKLMRTASTHVKRLFDVNSLTGDIRLTRRLDYDIGPKAYAVPVMIFDNGKPSRSSTTTVSIRLLDVNDEAPQITIMDKHNRFPPQPEVYENSNTETFVCFVTVKDSDSGPSGSVACSVDNSAFRLSPVDTNMDTHTTDYELLTTRSLDRESRSIERVTILCQDRGTPHKITEKEIDVSILDRNDNPPRFASTILNATISENRQKHSLVTVLNASDADEHPKSHDGLSYSLNVEGVRYFSIDSRSGQLFTLAPFDRETLSRIPFSVTASDSGTPQLNTTARVTVYILDENDCAPEFESDFFTFTVQEESNPGQLVGVLSAKDRDAGINKEFSMHIDDIRGLAQSTFSLDSRSGKLFTRRRLNREDRPEYDFDVVVRDRGRPMRSGKTSVKVIVADINDNAPNFVYPTKQNHTVHCSVYNLQGTPVVKLTAIDKDIGGNSELLFLITQGNKKGLFELDPKTGDMALTRDLKESDEGEYRLALEVRDTGSSFKSAYSSIVVILDKTSPRQRLPGTGPRDQRRPGGYFHDLGSDRNLVLVVCLVVIATVLAVIFLFIVIWLKRKPTSFNGRRRGRFDDVTGSASGSRRRLTTSATSGTTCSDHPLSGSKREIRLAAGTLDHRTCLTNATLSSKDPRFDSVKFAHLTDESGGCGGDEASDISFGCRVSEDSGRGGSHDQLISGTLRTGQCPTVGQCDPNFSSYYQQLTCTECPSSLYTATTFRSCRPNLSTSRSTATLPPTSSSNEQNHKDRCAMAAYQALQPCYSTLKLVRESSASTIPTSSADREQNNNSPLLHLNSNSHSASGQGVGATRTFRLKSSLTGSHTVAFLQDNSPTSGVAGGNCTAVVSVGGSHTGLLSPSSCDSGGQCCNKQDCSGSDEQLASSIVKKTTGQTKQPFSSNYTSSFV